MRDPTLPPRAAEHQEYYRGDDGRYHVKTKVVRARPQSACTTKELERRARLQASLAPATQYLASAKGALGGSLGMSLRVRDMYSL